MRSQNRAVNLLIAGIIVITATVGCKDSVGTQKNGAPVFSSYTEIPGVTETEINDIEALRSSRERFIYGACLATEAFKLPDGRLAGFSKEFCELLTGLFGIEFALELHGWDELVSGLESGSIDFTGEMTPTEERMLLYWMTPPIAERMMRVVMHIDSEIKTESDMNGLRLGFLTDSITAESILSRYHLTFTGVDVANYEVAAEMILNGEIDAFVEEAVADPAFSGFDFIRSQIFFPMVHTPVSMTAFDPALASVISVVSKYIEAGGLDKLYELYRAGDFEYARFKLDQALTPEERSYIDFFRVQDKAIAVAFEHDNYPISFYNEKDSAFEGIAVDVLEEISLLTGLRFEPAVSESATWSDIYAGLNTGEIHMVAQLLRSQARESLFLWTDVPYASSYYALMTKSDYPNLETYQISRLSVGATKGSAKIDIFYSLFPDHEQVIEYDTQDECLDALERGEFDVLMASEYMLLTQVNYREKSGFKINIKLDIPLDSHFGFSINEAVLCSIINKAQQYVKTDSIEMNWTGRSFDYSKRLAEESARSLTVFLVIMILVLIVTLFILLKNVALSKKLKEMAHTDALTGIYNRRFFMELSAFQMARSTRTNIDCFIMIFDLDHFKAVNDTYGHLAGDEVLKEVATRVKNTIRPYDVLGRYGGEEFIVLMTDEVPISKDNAILAAERIREEISKAPVLFEETEINVSASIGIAHASPVNDLMTATKLADEALYIAKETGRNKVVYHDDE